MATRKVDLQRKPKEVQEPDTIEVLGEVFTLSDSPPGMALLDMASAGDDEQEAMLAFRTFIKSVLKDEDEWNRFHDFAVKERLDVPEILLVVQELAEMVTNRPTQPSSDSPDGLPTDGSTSGDGSS